jgi:methyl-accepting chemotaxis protein
MPRAPAPAKKSHVRKLGLGNFRIRTKLLLSIGVLAFGYLLFLGTVQWTAATLQHHLSTASDSLFPAALAGQAAEASFQKLNIDYKDAVVMQNPDKLDTADDDARTIAAELTIFREKTAGNAELQQRVARLQAQFNDFSQNSRTAYAGMIGASGRLDPQVLTKLKDLAGMSTEIAAALKDMDDNASRKYFQQELNAIARAIHRQRLLTILLFLVVFGFASWTSRILEQEISVPLGRAVEALNALADGDLTVKLSVDSKDEVGKMGFALNRAIARVRAPLRKVAESAANTRTISQQLAIVSETIASGAQKQAKSLQATAASLEQITAAVRQSADNAKHARELATGSKDSAERGQDVVAKAITAMSEISTASAKISDIISNIDEIAFQTNLLAVNAAIEAARAGEQGRGFAVVAAEVRSLALRSATSAREIKALIQDSMRKVARGSEMVTLSGETLQSIFASVKSVTDIVTEIALAAEEQRTGIEQVNTAVTEVDHVTQSNSTQTEELSSRLEWLDRQSEGLMQLISNFTLGERVDADGDESADTRSEQEEQSGPLSKSPQRAAAGGAIVTRVNAFRVSGAAEEDFDKF